MHVFTQPVLVLNHPSSANLLFKCSHCTLYVLTSFCSSWCNDLNPAPFLSPRAKCVWWIWRVRPLHIICIYMEETCWQCPLNLSSHRSPPVSLSSQVSKPLSSSHCEGHHMWRDGRHVAKWNTFSPTTRSVFYSLSVQITHGIEPRQILLRLQ